MHVKAIAVVQTARTSNRFLVRPLASGSSRLAVFIDRLNRCSSNPVWLATSTTMMATTNQGASLRTAEGLPGENFLYIFKPPYRAGGPNRRAAGVSRSALGAAAQEHRRGTRARARQGACCQRDGGCKGGYQRDRREAGLTPSAGACGAKDRRDGGTGDPRVELTWPSAMARVEVRTRRKYLVGPHSVRKRDQLLVGEYVPLVRVRDPVAR